MLGEHVLSDHMSKFIGFGSDGASNMTGVKAGLVTLLRKDFPEIVGIHCLAHRLELSFRDVVKKDKNYDQLVTFLLGIYYYYKRSPTQKKGLNETFQVSVKH